MRSFFNLETGIGKGFKKYSTFFIGISSLFQYSLYKADQLRLTLGPKFISISNFKSLRNVFNIYTGASLNKKITGSIYVNNKTNYKIKTNKSITIDLDYKNLNKNSYFEGSISFNIFF